jgi:ADP-ribosylglycohydrolase
MLRFAFEHTPEGETHTGLRRALALPFERDPQIAAQMLGNGLKVTSPDTVPLALWCAARHWRNYPDAIWAIVSAFGDIDTNCAIVGGIVALSSVDVAIPTDWIAARGSLPLL